MLVRELVTLLGFKVDRAGLDEADRRAAALNSAFRNLAAKAAGVFAGFQVAGFIKDSVNAAARVETLDVVLSRMAGNVGKTKEQMAGLVEELQQTGIAGVEAREVLLRMMQAGLDVSHTSKLARLAQDAAVIGGTNSSQALEAIIHGIVTRQPEVLRTYGLQIDFERAFSGKAGKALTQQQKVAMAMNLVLKQGETIAGSYTAAMQTAGKKLGSLTRLQDDFKASFGKLFLGTFGDIIDELSKFFSWFRKVIDKDANGHFATLGKTVHLLYQGIKFLLVPVLQGLYWVFDKVMRVVKVFVDNGRLAASVGIALAGAFAVAKWAAIVGVFTKLMKVIRAIAIFMAIASWPLLAIAAVVALVALVIDDLWAWANDQESVAGKFLGPWKKVKEFFMGFRKFFESLPGVRLYNAITGTGGAVDPSRIGAQGGSRSINVTSKVDVQVPHGTSEAQKASLDEAARRAVKEEWDAITRRVMGNNFVME